MDPEKKMALRFGAAALVLVAGGVILAKQDWRGWGDPMPQAARDLAKETATDGQPAARGAFAFGQGTSLCALEPWYDGEAKFLQRMPREGDGFGEVPIDLGRIHPLGREVTQDVIGSAFCQRGRGNVFYRLHYSDSPAGGPYAIALTAWQDPPLGADQAQPQALFSARLARSGWKAEDFDGPDKKAKEAAVRHAAIDDNLTLSDALGRALGIVPLAPPLAGRPVADHAKPLTARPKGSPASWVTKDDYPALALKEKREGTARFRAAIGTDGRVRNCEITASSGHADLDVATCEAVRRHARFAPARDASGRLTDGSWSQAVRWQVPDD